MNICSNKLCFLATDVTLNLTSCALRHFRFILNKHLSKTDAGIGTPDNAKGDTDAKSVFFMSCHRTTIRST